MENRPSELLKSVAIQLSQLIVAGDDDQQRKEKLLSQLCYVSGEETADNGMPVSRTGSGEKVVGIWKQQSDNGQAHFTRDPARKNEWRLWANTHDIRPKDTRKRIVLLGESAARGYLYDPCYNVARELEAVMNKLPVADKIEVVDLAKTSLQFSGLFELTNSCIALNPDAVVIFAGNNWVFSVGEGIYDYTGLLDLYRRESFQGIKCMLENELRKKVLQYFKLIESVFLKNNIAVVFVIPEFNLRDWKSSDAERILPWVPDDRIEKWLHVKQRARLALENKDLLNLETASGEMTELDPSNPEGFELLADYFLNTGQWSKARHTLELARDTILFNRSSSSMPRCVSVIRETIVDQASHFGIRVVDLPAVFKKHYHIIPDRTLFLDNCHMTVAGIKMAMRYTAQALAEVLYDRSLDEKAISDSGILPGKQVQAMAHFAAAIYNSHYGQTREIIQYHCDQAVSLSEKVLEPMRKYLDLSARKTSTIFCRSFEQLVMEGDLLQYEGGLALRHPRNHKLMDIVLAEAIMKALQSKKINIQQEINELRIREHGIGIEKTSLLESFYSHTNYQNFNNSVPPGFIQVRSTKSSFLFVTDGSFPLLFELVYRLPLVNVAAPVITVSVNSNQQSVAALPAVASWKKLSFIVDNQFLQNGVNELIITWPYSPSPIIIKHPVTSDSFMTAIFPAVGEIHALDAVILGGSA